jgi:putative ABC transport system ATP-binding protein
MIRLENIHLIFSEGTAAEKHVLNNLSLSIDEGNFVTVIGSNGAGKSSLLNMIAGEYRPQRGTILMDNLDVTNDVTFQRAINVARVFQDPSKGTCGDLTIAENLALAEYRGHSRGLGRALTAKKRHDYQDILSQVGLGLESRLDTQMFLLSGGQRQAVSLLMAALSPLKILLLDEHTSALDPKTAGSIMAFTDRLIKEKGLTALMVTHSLHQALDFGNRTFMMHEGRVIMDIQNPKRAELTVPKLMELFQEQLDTDELLGTL